MELGATVCTPRQPRCGACPVRRHCRAFASGTPELFPPVAERRAAVAVRRAVAWITRPEQAAQVLLARREGSLLAGLWEPPGVELAEGADARKALAAHLRSLGLRVRLRDSGLRVKHAITHRSITVERWEGGLSGEAPASGALRWWAVGSRRLGVTALTTRLAKAR